MKPESQKLDPQNSTHEEPYDEEKDPTTPYLNPGFRVDLYENSWLNILYIILALIAFIAAVFGFFLIFFGPLTAGVMYHQGMWIAFLIIFAITLAVSFPRATPEQLKTAKIGDHLDDCGRK